MKQFIMLLCVMLLCVSGAQAYTYNFQSGPFPYPYPNTLDDYPNTAYCYNQTTTCPTTQYVSYKVEGVIVPYIQPDGRVFYYWSYNKMTSLGTGVHKVKPVNRPRPLTKEVKYDSNYRVPVTPAMRHKWGKPF